MDGSLSRITALSSENKYMNGGTHQAARHHADQGAKIGKKRKGEDMGRTCSIGGIESVVLVAGRGRTLNLKLHGGDGRTGVRT